MPTAKKFVDNSQRRASLGLTRSAGIYGTAIKSIMKQRGLKQAAVAEFVGVSQPAVSRWMNCQDMPQGENLLRLSEALGVEPSFLTKATPRQVKLLGKAIRPGEFHPDLPDDFEEQSALAAVRAREVAVQRVALKIEPTGTREEEATTRLIIGQALSHSALKGDWRSRIAIAGKRCMICAVPMRHEGMCGECLANGGQRD